MNDVDAWMHAALFGHTAAGRAEKPVACESSTITHRAVFFVESQDRVELREVAIHREHAVGRDQAQCACLAFARAAFELGHVAVRVAVALGFAEANAVVISDALNHASIIDGIRLCKAERRRYANGDMAELEKHLAETQGKRTRLIATDGVFSMDGFIAKLDEIVALKKKYNALLMVDDSHATGFVGPTGRGSAELHGVMKTSTSSRRRSARRSAAVPAASRPAARRSSTCCASARGRTCSRTRCRRRWSRRRSRCSRCSSSSTALRDKVNDNALYFRKRMTEAGFDIRPGTHPIAPVMLYDAKLAQAFAKELLDEGIYVIGFFYPVVPQGQARIRTQMSAAHTREQIDRAVEAFVKVGRRLGVLKA